MKFDEKSISYEKLQSKTISTPQPRINDETKSRWEHLWRLRQCSPHHWSEGVEFRKDEDSQGETIPPICAANCKKILGLSYFVKKRESEAMGGTKNENFRLSVRRTESITGSDKKLIFR